MRPQRSKSRLRCPAFRSKRTTGRESVGATFQLGGKFGIGRSGGIRNATLISLTSEERRARPHMVDLLYRRPSELSNSQEMIGSYEAIPYALEQGIYFGLTGN